MSEHSFYPKEIVKSVSLINTNIGATKIIFE